MKDRDKKKKKYVPWHNEVNEKAILALTKQFVEAVYEHRGRLMAIDIKWDKDIDSKFTVNTYVNPISEDES